MSVNNMWRPEGWENPYHAIIDNLKDNLIEATGSTRRHYLRDELYSAIHSKKAYEKGADAMLEVAMKHWCQNDCGCEYNTDNYINVLHGGESYPCCSIGCADELLQELNQDINTRQGIKE